MSPSLPLFQLERETPLFAFFGFGYWDFRAALLECAASRSQKPHGDLDYRAPSLLPFSDLVIGISALLFLSVLQVVPKNRMATSTIERLPIFPLGAFALHRSTRPLRFNDRPPRIMLGSVDYRALFYVFAFVSPFGILHAYLVFLFLPPIIGRESYVVALITTPKFVPSSFTVYYSLEPFSCRHCVPAYLSFPRVYFCKVADYFCSFGFTRLSPYKL